MLGLGIASVNGTTVANFSTIDSTSVLRLCFFPSLPAKKRDTIQYSRKPPVTITFGSHKSDRCFSPVRTQGFQCVQTLLVQTYN